MSNKVEMLKEKVEEALKNSDIASLYVLEAEAHEVFNEDTLQDYYANILDLALGKLTDTLESHQKFDMSEVQDFATTRALYEYAMEHYSTEALKDAASLFEVLSGMTNDEKFSWSLKLHWLAAAENIKLDDFISTIADIEATEANKTFYISGFTKAAQKLLDSAQSKGE
ncbi:MAG: hypothetical protein U9O86_01545 [Campylobacterota bacterium]|nr:hypothetical protein [Campylobacterota bacterium]